MHFSAAKKKSRIFDHRIEFTITETNEACELLPPLEAHQFTFGLNYPETITTEIRSRNATIFLRKT